MPFGFGGRLFDERRTGGDPFLELHREVNRLFDDVVRGAGRPMPSTGQGGLMAPPHMDVSETENEIRICAELPGVSQDDVEVTLDDNVLTIRGEKRAASEQQRESYHVMERSFGRFQRAIQLPFAPEPDQVQAAFEHGVLTITLPKTARQQERTRRIEVRGGAGGGGGRTSISGGEPSKGAGAGEPIEVGGPGEPSKKQKGSRSRSGGTAG